MRRLRKQTFGMKGVTLAELLLSVVILAFAASALLQVTIGSCALNQTNRNLAVATIHAQYVLEEIKSTSFDNIKIGINNGNWNWNNAAISSKGLTPLTNETTATQVTGTDLLTVTVTVNWQDLNQRARSTVLQTDFSRP